MYDRLREMADGMDAESIDQLFQQEPKVGDIDEDERERREREYYRSQLEPKYVIVKHGGHYEFRAGYVDYHRTLLSYDEIRRGMCDGGGFWGVDGEQKRVTLYDSSSDFGRPKNIEAAIRQDGAHLLEMLGEVCDKTGEEHDLSDYTIAYDDAIRYRHVVLPPYETEPDIMGTEKMLHNYYDHGIHATLNTKKHKHGDGSLLPREFAKKKKAKARQQKQSRKRNRRR